VGTTRSSFIRDALQMALQQYRIAQLERQQAAGYARHPVVPGEFDIWESEQVWGDCIGRLAHPFGFQRCTACLVFG
jgi:hypothetical protein